MKVKVRYFSGKECSKDAQYYIDVLRYGFFLRFIHDHFMPCDKCQDELEKILVGKIQDWCIDEPLRVELDYYINVWRFTFPWICREVVLLCKKCSKVLEDGIKDADIWTIGNKDYEPTIELWRKWDTSDKLTARLIKIEKKAKKAGIHMNSFYANLRNKTTDKDVDEFFDVIDNDPIFCLSYIEDHKTI